MSQKKTTRQVFEEKYERRWFNEWLCWVWTACTHVKGYGQLCRDRKVQKAHRVSWQLFRGEIPMGLHVLHRCDNPPCVNPDHLFLGTNADNVADKVRKGRAKATVFGEGHHLGKLKNEQVRAIRIDRRGMNTVAAEYGVSTSTIWAIRRRIIWKQLED